MGAVEDIDLYGGHTLVVRVTDRATNFYVMHGTSRVCTVEVDAPFSGYKYREWDPQYDQPQYGTVDLGYTNDMSPAAAAAVGEVLAIAADYCGRLNDARAEELAYQEAAVREHDAKERQRQEQEQARRAEIQEAIQWYVGQKFKLRRRGYKATVFGTIDRVSERTIYTTSERGIAMTTEIDDLTELSIKYDGEKRYTKVYPA